MSNAEGEHHGWDFTAAIDLLHVGEPVAEVQDLIVPADKDIGKVPVKPSIISPHQTRHRENAVDPIPDADSSDREQEGTPRAKRTRSGVLLPPTLPLLKRSTNVVNKGAHVHWLEPQIPPPPQLTTSPAPHLLPRDSRQTLPREIEPLVDRSPVVRRYHLISKLAIRFPADARAIVRLPSVSKPGVDAVDGGGIHIFVDASNIFIGFHETLKKARGIREGSRTRSVPFSFYSFSLILERGRPVARRVLAGSKPANAAIAEAERSGYKCDMLDRVLKAREAPSPRRRTDCQTAPTTSDYSSSDAKLAPMRMVEQAVDELLHMKMLESLLDYGPSTMVLASGDAAVAEFSPGFVAAVTRALERGWKVEIYSFRRNLSSIYRNLVSSGKWHGMLKIISLDPYAEELLDY
ncbi:MAG: hypothetical protein M1826_001450 [Phylliscum demangeonii]|nr:MAG: hypothetical protein M1826_001450 [Phylliscum demangeonii]